MTSNSRLRDHADAIRALEDQRRQIAEDIKDRYTVAKSDGFTVTALRRAIKISDMDATRRAKHDSEQTDLELYLAEIEGREAAE